MPRQPPPRPVPIRCLTLIFYGRSRHTAPGAGYVLDQNGQRRGHNDAADYYNNMGYFPRLMGALMNKQAPTQSVFNPAWLLPGY